MQSLVRRVGCKCIVRLLVFIIHVNVFVRRSIWVSDCLETQRTMIQCVWSLDI
ncbi:hypothetical protein HanIR_Chr04g0151201 [Helianthus annuus]|nr:hypothetical protein HanIR_Chr04g0151201 [Helianthus annuus]